MKIEKKSPLKSNPLRNPGQSLDEEIADLLEDKVVIYCMIIGFAVFIVFYEWYRWFRPHPPSPLIHTILFGLISAYCGHKLVQFKKQLRRLKLGRDGERAVGQYLERLRQNGAQVFHDIISNNFNLDHVVVSANGIFLIETKTYSKPKKGSAIIKYNGKSLQFNNGFINKEILVQAKAGASWLRELIEESTGKKVFVRPVVVFPGWYIENNSGFKKSDIWVLNPKALPKYIGNGFERLKTEDVSLISSHLSKYIRNYKKDDKPIIAL